jgi:hypothetical protein
MTGHRDRQQHDDAAPDDAPGVEVPAGSDRDTDSRRRREKPGEHGGPGLDDLNDAVAPDALSGPATPEDERA